MDRWRSLVRRLARVGVRPGDDPDLVVRKQTLTIAAVTITLLAGVWVATYLLLGRPLAAAIPLDAFRFERREPMEVKGKGRMATFFLLGRRT